MLLRGSDTYRRRVEDAARNDRTDELGHDVRQQLVGGEATASEQANGNRGIQVTAGNVPDCKGHGQHGQAECQRDTNKTNSHFRKSRSQHRRPTTAQHQPECTNEFGNRFLRKTHDSLLL